MTRFTSCLSLCLFLIPMVLTGSATGQHHDTEGTHQHDPGEQSQKDSDRWMWQLPARVIRTMGVQPGMTVADVGAGNGYFTLRLAEAVGVDGQVYAADIDRPALEALALRCQEEGFTNVTTVPGRPDDPLLPAASCDVILLVNVFHLLEDPATFLANLKPGLRPDGTLVFVQWDADKLASEEPRMGDTDRVLFSSERLEREVVAAGFETDRVETFLPVQNIFVFRVKP